VKLFVDGASEPFGIDGIVLALPFGPEQSAP
jgi:hypothetical protein